MEAENNILGKTQTLSGYQALLLLEQNISEGISLAEAPGLTLDYNLWGRKVHLLKEAGLSYAAGMALNGLRTAAFGEQGRVNSYLDDLSYARRQLLGMVLHLSPADSSLDTGDHRLPPPTGCLQLQSQEPQQAADFAAIAHRVAELSLSPVVHALAHSSVAFSESEITLPGSKALSSYLGDPDAYIESPTPAQQMILGPHRRRLPNWYSFDTPMLSGVKKDPNAISLEEAARQQFFLKHLPELLERAFSEWATLTGRAYASLTSYRAEDARYLFLAQGMDFGALKAWVDRKRQETREKIGCLALTCLYPFPGAALAALLKGKKGVTVLEPIPAQPGEAPPLFQAVRQALTEAQASQQSLFSGRIAKEVDEQDLEAAFSNMVNKGKQHFFLGLDFSRKASDFPKQQILFQTLNRLYPDLPATSLPVEKKEQGSQAPLTPADMPFGVRQYQDHGPPYSKLSRFYDHTALYYQQGRREEEVADPFQALSLAPPVSAQFDDYAGQRKELPQFIPENCTGCGRCFIYCPHAALPPLAIGMEALLRAAMDISARQGHPVSSLTPLVKNLARQASKSLRREEAKAGKVATFLPAAFNTLASQLDAGKRESASQDFEAVLQVIGEMPVAVTDTFFQEAEMREKGAGELFTLAVDPHACTACGKCVELCPEEALHMQPQTPQLLKEAQERFHLWEQLPDTSGDTLTRLLHEKKYDPFAAILLSRNFYTFLSGGGSNSETGSKTLLHLAGAVTESLMQPRFARQTAQLEELIEGLGEQIHQQLSDSLPHDNFEHLTQVLQAGSDSKLSFGEMAGKLDKLEHSRLLDKPTLLRKLSLLEDLKRLKALLSEGPTGTGRARQGWFIPEQAAMSWAVSFPYNPFTAPVLLSPSNFTQVAGLIQGQMRHLLDNLKLLRRAKLELRNQYDPDSHDATIARLDWPDLEEEEKGLFPPILLAGRRRNLQDAQIAQIQKLLASGWPVKLLLLDDAQGLPVAEAEVAQRTALLTSVLAMRQVFVLQSSLAQSQHFFDGLQEGLSSQVPAFFLILETEQDNLADPGLKLQQAAALALQSRAFPLLQYRPAAAFLATEISLAGNPDPQRDWASGVEQGTTCTYADWAFAQTCWRDKFLPYEEEMGPAISLEASLEKPDGKAIPILSKGEEQWTIPEEIVAGARAARDSWRTLQELAGLRNPFPAKLREEVERELNEAHAKEVKALKAAHQDQLQALEQEHLEKIKIRIRDKLMALGRMRE